MNLIYPPKAFIDMDGVLVDFLQGISDLHGRPNPYLTDPKSFGVWDTEQLWGISPKDFWKPVEENSYEFWSTLKPTEEALDIVDVVCREFGVENVAILTHPSTDDGCVPGKRDWINQYFPQFEKRVIYGGAKEFLAGPNRLLVDDKDKNVDKFREAGGQAVLLPRAWNRAYGMRTIPISVLNLEIDRFFLLLNEQNNNK